MKHTHRSIISLILFFSFVFFCISPCLAAEDEPVLDAKAAILMDASTGNVLYNMNGTTPLYTAGLTVMMTALLISEKVENEYFTYDDIVTVGDYAYFDVTSDAATQNLLPGEQISVIDLLRCAIIGGASEACNILAEYSCGSVSDFLSEMNTRARELGCTNTSFANTHGLPNDSSYSTALDMARIASAFTSHDKLMEISNTTTYDIPATNLSNSRRLTSSNFILRTDYTRYYYSYACGIKAGYTDDAGFCLASSVKTGGNYVVSIVLGCHINVDESGFSDIQSFIQTKNLFKWFSDHYRLRTVVSSLEPIAEVPVALGEGMDAVVVCSRENLELFLPVDLDISNEYTRNIKIFSQQPGSEPLTAPIAQGTVLGEMTVTSSSGINYGPYELIANTDVSVSRVELIRQRFSQVFHNRWFKLCFWGLIFILIAYFAYITYYRIRRVKERQRQRAQRKAAEQMKK